MSEIDSFCSALLTERWPNIPNLGDLLNFQSWPDYAIDILVGGTPCQPFSIAGFRAGLADPRGNLMLTYLAVAARYRPRWLVWENVPGVLSSNQGRDFGTLLGGMAKLGYGFAYRVLDTQYVRTQSHPRAIPQRRRRVFVVGHLGDWRRSAAVLFERESLSGHPAPRRGPRQDVAGTLASRTTGGGGLGTDLELAGGVVPTLTVGERGTGDFELGGGLVARCVTSSQQRLDWETENFVAHPLLANANSSHDDSKETYVAHTWGVRRLMPIECERLQGFPDGYTAIRYKGKPAKDSPRYKATGNSMSTNVMEWIGKRIESVERIK